MLIILYEVSSFRNEIDKEDVTYLLQNKNQGTSLVYWRYVNAN